MVARMPAAGQRTSERRLFVADRLPMPAGASPFRVKGHVYSKMIEDFEETVEGGIVALAARTGEPGLEDFVRQRFMAGAWYDALPMMPLSLAHARAVGAPLQVHLRDRGRWVAERDIPTIYRVLLRLTSPETVVSRLARAATQYFDFGACDVRTTRPGHAEASLAGVPRSLVPLVAATTEGFVCAALEMAGGKDVNARCVDTPRDGAREGIPTMVVRLEIAWS
jgi:hypothetical protein